MVWWLWSGLLACERDGVESVAQFISLNPTTGSQWVSSVYRPESDPSGVFPGIVLLPGARNDRSHFEIGEMAQRLANRGYTVITPDPEGRGESEGVEDDNGFIGQDGLYGLVMALEDHPGVSRPLTLASKSFGVALSAGVLGRYPEVPVDLCIDWEGPTDRVLIGGCGEGISGHLSVDCGDEDYWVQREPVGWIGQIMTPYVRLQSQTDHVQPNPQHALDMINRALLSGVDPVWLNTVQITEPLETLSQDQLIPDSEDSQLGDQIHTALQSVL